MVGLYSSVYIYRHDPDSGSPRYEHARCTTYLDLVVFGALGRVLFSHRLAEGKKGAGENRSTPDTEKAPPLANMQTLDAVFVPKICPTSHSCARGTSVHRDIIVHGRKKCRRHRIESLNIEDSRSTVDRLHLVKMLTLHSSAHCTLSRRLPTAIVRRPPTCTARANTKDE